MTAVHENVSATGLPDGTATELFIGGQWRAASDGGTFTDLNPATARPLAQIASGTAQDIDDAVRAARTQLNGEWGSLPGAARGRILNKVADLIERDGEILARLEALDVGKPVGQPTMLDIPHGRRHVPALRRLGRQDHRPVHPDCRLLRPAHALVHRPRTGRRDRRDRSVEHPADDRGMEDRPGARRRQHAGGQAAGGRTAVDPSPRDAAGGGRTARRHRQRRARARRGRRRRTRRPPRRRQDQLHRQPRASAGSSPSAPPTRSSAPPSNSAASPRRSSSPTPTSRPPSTAPRWDCSSTRARSAPRAPASWCTARCTSQVVDGLAAAASAQVLGDPFDPATTMGALVNAKQRDTRPRLHRGRTRARAPGSPPAVAARTGPGSSSSRPSSPTRTTT